MGYIVLFCLDLIHQKKLHENYVKSEKISDPENYKHIT